MLNIIFKLSHRVFRYISASTWSAKFAVWVQITQGAFIPEVINLRAASADSTRIFLVYFLFKKRECFSEPILLIVQRITLTGCADIYRNLRQLSCYLVTKTITKQVSVIRHVPTQQQTSMKVCIHKSVVFAASCVPHACSFISGHMTLAICIVEGRGNFLRGFPRWVLQWFGR